MWFLLVHAALALDQGPWQKVLDTYVDANGRVDYQRIHDSHALDAYVESLKNEPEPADRNGRIAFWLNAYDALTIQTVATSYPISSIRDLDGGKVWDTRTFRVAGRNVTLNQIENNMLRPMGDPRVHAALNCASIGCPPLTKTAFSVDKLDDQLSDAAKRWVSTNGVKVDQSNKVVTLSKVFDWYGDDFLGLHHADIPGVDGKEEAACDFAARYLSADQAAFLAKGGYAVRYADYDWSLNKQ